MGCDIHCYVEYKRPDSDFWSGFGGRINPGRYYGAFTRMAGVRNYNKIAPIAAPRGLPDDIAWEAQCDSRLYVVECDDGRAKTSEGEVFRDVADRWVSEGSSRYVGHAGAENKFVSHPDWHSHSWLTPDEFEECIRPLEGAFEYQAILAAMRCFEALGCASRLVFWFDN